MEIYCFFTRYSIFSPYSIILKALLCLMIHRTSSHIELSLSNDNVCKLDFDVADIKLRGGENSVVVIRDNNFFSSYTGRYGFTCKFVVKVKDKDDYDEGIYAVIQDLNFRKEENGTCRDWVEFSTPQSKILGLSKKNAQKFCGELGPGMWLPMNKLYDSSNEQVDLHSKRLTPNAYVAYGGEVHTEIYISRERLQPKQKLVVTIAFTAYKKDCLEVGKTPLIHCRFSECIYSELERDGIQNCPYISCADEYGCRQLRATKEDDWTEDVMGSGIGTKVTFGAIAAIILILLKFALCLWVCKRVHRRRGAAQPAARRASMQSEPARDRVLPSAPPVDIESKDLPPSYESLFPTPNSRTAETAS